MVAAFGLGAGWAALDRAIAYSRKRIQAGGPLSREAGLHPQADRPARRRAGGGARRHRGDRRAHRRAARARSTSRAPIAKYLATEAGDAAADAAIQAHGGYGYTHDYMVEKIKRDVRITTDLRGHLGDHGDDDRPRALAGAPQDAAASYYHARARELEALHAEHPAVGADVAALAHHALAELLERCRVGAADPQPARPAAPRRADRPGRGRRGARPARAARGRQAAQPEGRARPSRRRRWPRSAACARASAALTVATEAIRWVAGADGGELGDLEQRLGLAAIHRAQAGLLADMQRGRRRDLRRKRP